METILAIHREEGPGDVLAFLTGQEEVEAAVTKLRWAHCRAIDALTPPSPHMEPLTGTKLLPPGASSACGPSPFTVPFPQRIRCVSLEQGEGAAESGV